MISPQLYSKYKRGTIHDDVLVETEVQQCPKTIGQQKSEEKKHTHTPKKDESCKSKSALRKRGTIHDDA